MVYENPLYDKKFKLAISDVVYRFYIRGQYSKDPEKAIKALAKRAPGYSLEDYRIQFENNLKLFIAITDKAREVYNSDKDYKKYLRNAIYWFYLR